MNQENPEVSSPINLDNLPKIEDEGLVEENILEKRKDLETKKEKLEIAKEKTKSSTTKQQTELQIEILESSPATPENLEQKVKILENVRDGLTEAGVDESKISAKAFPILEKAVQRIAQNSNATLEFNLVNGELLVAGMEQVDQNYLAMAALDAAFQNQIPDSILAKLDRFEIAKLASIFESGSFVPGESVALTPRAVRGFLALAKKSNFNFAELQNRGIFDEEWKVKTYSARSFAVANIGKLRDGLSADTYWSEKEKSKKENDKKV